MVKYLGVILIACFSFTLVSCCGCRINNSKQVSLLLNSSWQVSELNGKSIDMVADDSYTINFDIKKSEIFGRGDCNTYFSSYSVAKKNAIKFGAVGKTRMSCRNNDSESDFFNSLSLVDGFAISDYELILLSKGNVIMVLVTKKK